MMGGRVENVMNLVRGCFLELSEFVDTVISRVLSRSGSGRGKDSAKRLVRFIIVRHLWTIHSDDGRCRKSDAIGELLTWDLNYPRRCIVSRS